MTWVIINSFVKSQNSQRNIVIIRKGLSEDSERSLLITLELVFCVGNLFDEWPLKHMRGCVSLWLQSAETCSGLFKGSGALIGWLISQTFTKHGFLCLRRKYSTFHLWSSLPYEDKRAREATQLKAEEATVSCFTHTCASCKLPTSVESCRSGPSCPHPKIKEGTIKQTEAAGGEEERMWKKRSHGAPPGGEDKYLRNNLAPYWLTEDK